MALPPEIYNDTMTKEDNNQQANDAYSRTWQYHAKSTTTELATARTVACRNPRHNNI